MKQIFSFKNLKNKFEFFNILESSFLGKTNFLTKKKLSVIKNYKFKRRLDLDKMRDRRIVKKYILVKSNLETKPFFNEVKVPLKYERLTFKDSYSYKLFFKSSGSNIFVTLTTNKGEVIFSYSAGLFKKLRTRREKTTLMVATQLGQVLSVRLYRSNITKLSLYPQFSSFRSKSRLKSVAYGLNFLRTKYICSMVLILRITRNGMRRKKSRRR